MSLRTATAVAGLAALLAVSGCGKREKATGMGPAPVSRARPAAKPSTASVSTQPVTVSQSVGTVFGDELKLVGINAPASVTVGQPFDLEFVWQALKQPSADYTVAVHLDYVVPDEDFFRLNQDHAPPLPTSKWKAGEYVRWTKQVTLPANAPAGEAYQVEIYPYTVVPGTEPKQFRPLPVTMKGTGGKPKIMVEK